jgi:hypothetical protein
MTEVKHSQCTILQQCSSCITALELTTTMAYEQCKILCDIVTYHAKEKYITVNYQIYNYAHVGGRTVLTVPGAVPVPSLEYPALDGH